MYWDPKIEECPLPVFQYLKAYGGGSFFKARREAHVTIKRISYWTLPTQGRETLPDGGHGPKCLEQAIEWTISLCPLASKTSNIIVMLYNVIKSLINR